VRGRRWMATWKGRGPFTTFTTVYDEDDRL
jgi:hypothetical protein